MIYDFAFDPALVATWHDRRAASFFLAQIGLGHRRVLCTYPAADWRRRVMNELQAIIPDSADVAWQNASKRLEILLNHVLQTSSSRPATVPPGSTWLAAAKAEHRAFRFGGIVIGDCPVLSDDVIGAEQLLLADHATWSPPAPPVTRSPQALADALAPLLRCSQDVRFIDPYFDAGVPEFRDAMMLLLAAAQLRRSLAGLRLEIHLAIDGEDVAQEVRVRRDRVLKELDVARFRVADCETNFRPLLKSGVPLSVFCWADDSAAAEKVHNRYVLTELGGIAVQTGLDPHSPRRVIHTDDLTVLSREQHQLRWLQYQAAGKAFRLIHSAKFVGS